MDFRLSDFNPFENHSFISSKNSSTVSATASATISSIYFSPPTNDNCNNTHNVPFNQLTSSTCNGLEESANTSAISYFSYEHTFLNDGYDESDDHNCTQQYNLITNAFVKDCNTLLYINITG